MQCSRKLVQLPVSRAMLSSRLWAIRGLNTLSSKLPWLAAICTAVLLPITCTATIVRLSHWVGFTLPGMIELPGSFSGRISSPRPQRGPLASQRMSLAIFIRLPASTVRAPWAAARGSWPARAWNLLGALVKGRPRRSASRAATASPKPAGACSPVPTAVPPIASWCTWDRLARRLSSPSSSWAA